MDIIYTLDYGFDFQQAIIRDIMVKCTCTLEIVEVLFYVGKIGGTNNIAYCDSLTPIDDEVHTFSS